jgi:ABC-type nitrate/sulfonate/bicarbonate transport system ATPase subunit
LWNNCVFSKFADFGVYSSNLDAVVVQSSLPIQPKLQVTHLAKSFTQNGQNRLVLDGINLHLAQNEFVCLVGASGCGKSTLLKIVAGLIPPTSGTVQLADRLVFGPGADRGMIFQNYSLFPWRSVADNVGFGLELQGQSKAQRRERIHYYLEVVGLQQFANAYPKQLSGGMKQRVAIARALANAPAVLLMDEPFGALDAQTKEQMQLFMKGLWERTHISILMVTHDVEEACFLSERIYVMGHDPGHIKAEIPIHLPQHRPLDLKLDAQFIQVKRQVIDALTDAH